MIVVMLSVLLWMLFLLLMFIPGTLMLLESFMLLPYLLLLTSQSATRVPNVPGVSVAGVPGVPALVWLPANWLPTMLLASLLLLVYALLPTFLQLLTFLLSLAILLLMLLLFLCSNNETDILDYPTPVNLCKI
jgi:hypothetical protein